MRYLVTLCIALLFSTQVLAQNSQLALEYYEKGAYEKAITLLEPLLKKRTMSYSLFEKIIDCYQQLEQYQKVLDAIAIRKKVRNEPRLFVEEGYSYQLQNKIEKAEILYSKALEKVNKQPNYTFQVARSFEKKVLPKWALKVYKLGQKHNPKANYNYQIALLKGQLGDLEGMTNTLLDYAYASSNGTITVQRYLSYFLQEEANEHFATSLRKILVLRTQKQPDVYWNRFLSWFYVQQKELNKAFIQEKAVYKRNPESFYNIVALGKMAVAENQQNVAKAIFTFILNTTQDIELQLEAHYNILQIKIATSTPKEYPEITNTLTSLLDKYGNSVISVELQLLLANFKCFYLNQSNEAIALLNKTLQLPLQHKNKARVKLQLADIYVYNNQFNQAILYYAQVETNVKNDPLAHEASMKMAQTNYFKTDFNWALQQVKVLKKSASLLIANNATELFLLIKDNTTPTDTLQTALTLFAKADFKYYKNKKEEALQLFLKILDQQKGTPIEDDAIFKVAKIYEEQTNFTQAVVYYNIILNKHTESIFTDEALFFLAEIYKNNLNEPEKAKELYEKIVLNHSDSIYFTKARYYYRKLRGDSNI